MFEIGELSIFSLKTKAWTIFEILVPTHCIIYLYNTYVLFTYMWWNKIKFEIINKYCGLNSRSFLIIIVVTSNSFFFLRLVSEVQGPIKYNIRAYFLCTNIKNIHFRTIGYEISANKIDIFL